MLLQKHRKHGLRKLSDSVPKNEYESLQKKYEELQVKYSQMKKGTLLKMYDQL